MPTVRFVVRGVVQGVGFRWFVMREALQLDLRGWVSNMADGSVEVVAEGSEDALARIEVALARGPRGAVVRSVEKDSSLHESASSKSFDVR